MIRILLACEALVLWGVLYWKRKHRHDKGFRFVYWTTVIGAVLVTLGVFIFKGIE